MESLDLLSVVNPERIAREIAAQFDRWNMMRQSWLIEMTDLRNTVFASDISTTTNKSNQDVFRNKTTIPKLTQIYDNLVANYDASLFPAEDWFKFEPDSEEAANKKTKDKITGYMKTKTRQLKFRSFIRKALADWVLYGNCFIGLEFVKNYTIDYQTGEKIPTYIGPKPYIISPYDIVFNLNAREFATAPKIIRTLKSLGALKREIDTKPEQGYTKELVDKLLKNRQYLMQMKQPVTTLIDDKKTLTLIADGFNTIWDYYNSGLVEILEYYGDLLIAETGEFFPNAHIVVIDRSYVILNEPVRSWSGSHYIYNCPWRERPNNLYGVSPLANLVGMQHRLDKLENTKADVWDQIAYPIMKEKGDVEYYDGLGQLNGIRGIPGGVYRTDADGDVTPLAPDTTALQADTQINTIQQMMEDLAGAPKNTMGIRTPGEKTAYEVQTLDNAASRIFQHKIAYFEETLLEPLLNDMLELSRRNLDVTDMVRMTHDRLGVDTFIDINKDDLAATGVLHAIGSRYFARNAVLAQNLNTMLNSQFTMQMLSPHLDRLAIGKVLEEVLGLDKFNLIRENVGVEQDANTKRLAQEAQQQTQEESIPNGAAPTTQPTAPGLQQGGQGGMAG